jgi:hypothetical protein
MTYTGVRSGVFAVLGGREYDSRPIRDDGTVQVRSSAPDNPDPSRFAWNDNHGQWLARVPATELDRLFQANVYAKYQGHLVNLTAINESGNATAYFAEGDEWWAEENGFTQTDKFVWVREIPVWELRDVHERQDDLLFRPWRAANFPEPPARGRRP